MKQLLYIVFISISGKEYVMLSQEKEHLSKYLKDNHFLLNFTKAHIQEDNFTVKNLVIKKYLRNIFKDNPIVYIPYVRSSYEMDVWLQIKTECYIPFTEWDNFLDEHNLLEEWIDGKVNFTSITYQTEFSRDFGERFMYSENVSSTDITKRIWDFPKVFNSENDVRGSVYSSHYIQKIVSVLDCKEKIFINEDWKKNFAHCPMNVFLRGNIDY